MKGILIATLAAVGLGASAQLIVGNDQSGVAPIYVIDVNTGIASPIITGSVTANKPWGMAADNVNHILYLNNGGQLYAYPMASIRCGNPTFTQTTLTYNAGAVNYVGLGFNPNTGKLMGTRNIATEAVYEIDVTTGVGTLLWAYPTTFDMGGVEYANDKLYCLSDTAPTGNVRGLYEVDYANMTTTFISGYPGTETDIDGLAVNGNNAYYVSDGPMGTQANFYVYDIPSGTQVGTLPSPFTGSGTFSAATWAPALGPRGRGDVNGDGCVDDTDLAIALSDFGSNCSLADMNNDGVVDDIDLAEVLAAFGEGC